MDLYEAWQEHEKRQQPDATLARETILAAISGESVSVMSILKQRLGWKLMWIVGAFIFPALAIPFFWQHDDVVLILTLAVVQGLLFGIPIGIIYLALDPKPGNSLLQTARRHDALIKIALRLEMAIGMGTAPWSVAIGLLLSNALLGHSVAYALQSAALLKTGIAAIIITIPIRYIVGKKANQKAYGQYQEQLRTMIHQLENLGRHHP